MRALTIAGIVLALLLAAALAALPPANTETEPGGAELKPRPPCRLAPPKRRGEFIAIAYDAQRKPDRRGFGSPIRGEIVLNGRCYHFVSGGHGRGSIPFGVYRVGEPMARPYLNPNPRHIAYPISDTFDPLIRDKRTALFIHPGQNTAGCIGIHPDQWRDFERDMEAVRPRVLYLVANGGADV